MQVRGESFLTQFSDLQASTGAQTHTLFAKTIARHPICKDSCHIIMSYKVYFIKLHWDDTFWGWAHFQKI